MKYLLITRILAAAPAGSIYRDMALYAMPMDDLHSIYREVIAQ